MFARRVWSGAKSTNMKDVKAMKDMKRALTWRPGQRVSQILPTCRVFFMSFMLFMFKL